MIFELQLEGISTAVGSEAQKQGDQVRKLL